MERRKTQPNYQYQHPVLPSHWSGDEKRFGQGLIDELDAIYAWRGRLGYRDLSPDAVQKIADFVDAHNNARLLSMLRKVGVLDDTQYEQARKILGV